MRHTLFDSLEPRRLMSISLGANLLNNGDAETGTGATTFDQSVAVSGWQKGGGNFTLVQYNSQIGPTDGTPGPTDRGNNFFAGGLVPTLGGTSRAWQEIDLSSLAVDIDAGRISYDASAWLGGYKQEADDMRLEVQFRAASTDFDEGQSVAGPTPAERNNQTALVKKVMGGDVPSGSRVVRVTLVATKQFGRYADGYADDVSFKLASNGDPTRGFITGRVYDDANGNGKVEPGEKRMSGVGVYVDRNRNGRHDKGEWNALTDANGSYLIASVPTGQYTLREDKLPDGYRVTTSSRPTIVVNGGLTTSRTFANSQTARIGGRVFIDRDFDGIYNPTDENGGENDSGAEDILVFLDLNENGQRDEFEPATHTDANGLYSFVVPFGTYRIRTEPLDMREQTVPADNKPFVLTVKKGQTVLGKDIGWGHLD
ncbi:MAG: MSCRAMM family protein [Tepidisphaeraceae bacterium]